MGVRGSGRRRLGAAGRCCGSRTLRSGRSTGRVTVGWMRRWWWAGVAAVVVVAGLVPWLVWPSTPAPRARVYKAFTACLLTDSRGIAGPQAAPVWAGMQKASLATHVKVEYLAVVGPDTVDNAR